MRRAKLLERILLEEPVVIQDGELIVGMKAPKPRGSPVYPEVNCAWVERDLETIATRPNTPFFVSPGTKRVLKREVFPFWRNRQIVDRILEAVPETIWEAERRGVLYNYYTSRTIGHFAVDYEKVLAKGFRGLMSDVQAILDGFDPGSSADAAKRPFLESILIVCRAAVRFAARYGAAAKRLARGEKNPRRRRELELIAGICARVPAEPSCSFPEALQSFWFTHLVLNLEMNGHSISPGRFDQYLNPYLEASLKSGELGPDEAQELLDLLWVKFDEITLAKNGGESDTSSSYPDFQQLNVGGLAPDGRDATNALSEMCLTALEHTRLPQPQLSALISSKTPPRFLARCAEILKLGLGMPALFNADQVVLGSVNRGKTLADARRASINGCVTTYCDGKDRAASSGYFNLAKCLELALNDGVDRLSGERLGPATGGPAEWTAFDDLVGAFRLQIRHFVGLKVAYDNIVRGLYAGLFPVPFVSALIDDCAVRGLDWHAGGSRYAIAVISGVGLGTVADSLSAIRTHVYDKKTTTMAALKTALDEDFRGRSVLAETLRRKTPHFGNDDDAADDLALLTQRIFCEEVEKHSDVLGARYWVDLLPTTAHIALGKLTGATPDGRKAGHWLSEGISPVQGRDARGPTAAAKSVAKLDHVRTNGTLLNMKFSPACLATDEDVRDLASFLRAYFDLGGYHIQLNVVDRATLQRAQERPEDYRNLLVRVAGYSDYFVLLSRDIQDEIISRTEHGL
jgi:formate C-acetyltransferase